MSEVYDKFLEVYNINKKYFRFEEASKKYYDQILRGDEYNDPDINNLDRDIQDLLKARDDNLKQRFILMKEQVMKQKEIATLYNRQDPNTLERERIKEYQQKEKEQGNLNKLQI